MRVNGNLNEDNRKKDLKTRSVDGFWKGRVVQMYEIFYTALYIIFVFKIIKNICYKCVYNFIFQHFCCSCTSPSSVFLFRILCDLNMNGDTFVLKTSQPLTLRLLLRMLYLFHSLSMGFLINKYFRVIIRLSNPEVDFHKYTMIST